MPGDSRTSPLKVLFAVLATLGCGSNAPEEPAPPEHPAAPATWPEAIEAELTRVYGPPSTGTANPSSDGVPEYVYWIAQPDHVVYVTRGAYRRELPHEFVMRVRLADPPRDARLWQVAPEWPSRALAEIARVEPTLPRPFAPGNYLRNVTLEGLPLRHFAFVTDPVLGRLELPGAAQPLVFVQVVPLSDDQLASIDAIPTGATNTVLRDWAARDPLLIADAP